MFDIVTDIPQPKDLGIMFKDIVTGGRVERVKANAMLESDYKQFVKSPIKENVLIKKRIAKGKQTPNLVYNYNNDLVRTINQIEMERLQGFPDGYTSILSKSKSASLLGDGWTLPIIEHIFTFIKR